ncbi:MAG: hypothetical protein RIG62_19480 [Cyclobacteriaceae bacterium]
MKVFISIITGISLISLIGCNNTSRNNDRAKASDADTTQQSVATTIPSSEITPATSTASAQSEEEGEEANYTETEEVVQVDTVGMTVEYDVNRRTIEQVDTVGATTTYEVERKIIKRRVRIDTVTETASEEKQVTYEEGDYKVLNEEVEKDTVTKTFDNPTPEEINAHKDSETTIVKEVAPQNAQREKTPVTNEQNENQNTQALPETEETSVQEQTNRPNTPQENEVEESSALGADSLKRNAPSYQPVQQDTVTESSSKNSR